MLPQITRDLCCVTLYSQSSRRSGSSETPDDHVSACYKLGEQLSPQMTVKFHGVQILLRLYGYYHGFKV